MNSIKINNIRTRAYICTLGYILFCSSPKNYINGQEFNNIISKDSITSFFYKNNIEKKTNIWGFTFIDKDSVKLKSTIGKLTLPNVSFSEIYLTDSSDDPKNRGFAENHYAIDLIEVYDHSPKSLYRRYKSFINISENLGLSLIGFHIEIPREKYLSQNKIETNKRKIDDYSAKSLVFKGYVLDKVTGNSIPYVNIGFFEKNVGTVSNQDGFFVFKIPQNLWGNEVTFSCIGYKTKKISLDTLTTNSLKKIFLEEDVTSLDEVTVYSKTNFRTRKKVLGIKNVSGKQSGFINGKGAGAEIGRLMRNRNRAKITSVSVHIGGNRLSEFKLRLNIYSANDLDSLPMKNLMLESKIIESNLNFGWLTIILDQPIFVDSDFFVAFEWLDANISNPVISLKGSASDGNVYQRSISQGQWKKSHDFNWAIKCEVQILK